VTPPSAIPATAREVIGGGLRIVSRFIKAQPWAFALAVTGATLFSAGIIATSVVIGWITDTAVLPVLTGDVPASERIPAIVLAVVGVAVWKAAAIVLRRTSAGWLQFRNQQTLRGQLIGHQLDLELAWFGRQSIGDLLSIADNDTQRSTRGCLC
jgi:ABC-type multidrug transport system fused ATPase/permease subunit